MLTAPDGLVFYMPERITALTFDEIYLMRVYGEQDLSGMTVIDVGAYIADSSLYFSRCGAEMVYSFEPDAATFEYAKRNVEANNLQQSVTIFNERAEAGKINMLMQQANKPVFLKIDCEGCEYELMKGLDMSKVTDVYIEYHERPDSLIEMLERAGLRVKVKGEIITATHQRF
jgi:hypothetical protein